MNAIEIRKRMGRGAAAMLLAAATLGASATAGAQTVWSKQPIVAYYGIGGDAKRVYAAGRAFDLATNTFDVVVDAYDPPTGQKLWSNVYDSGEDEAAGLWLATGPKKASDLRNDLVKADGGRVFVGGLACAVPGLCNVYGYFTESTLYAYDAATGAMLWNVRNHVNEIADNGTMALEAAFGRVYIGSYGTVRAYDEASGALLWDTQVDNEVSGLEYRNGRLFVGFDASNNFAPALVQALDPTTGQSLWENDDPLAGGAAPVWDIVTDKTRLFGVGRRAGGFYELRAFDQATGAVLWRYPGANDPVTVATGIGVATGVGRVFTTGMTTPFGDPALGTHLFVRAHDAGTGQLFWQKDVVLGGYAAGYSVSYLSGVARTLLRGRPDTSGDHPRIPANAGLVVVAGYGYDANGDSFGDIRAYEPYSGQLLWEQTVGFPGSLNQLVALRRVGKRMVAVGTRTKELGFGTGDSKFQDGLIACYE